MNFQNDRNDLISVVIPVYKIEKYIGSCLESIQKQTYENIEILVVNDGSPDKSAEIAHEYAKNDSRIKVIDKKNGGLSDARNVGIEKAKGNYILLVDGDDYIAENMIEKMYDAIKESKSDLCICSINIVDENGQCAEHENFKPLIEPGIYTKEQMFEKITDIPNWFYVVAWNKLYKREIFDKVKYPKGRIHEDEFVIHHIMDAVDQTICLEDRFYYYVQRNQSIMHADYSIKRMDVADAFLDRTDFFLNKHKITNAKKMFVRVRAKLIEGYIALNENSKMSKEDKERMMQLHKEYCKVYKKICKNGISFKERILLGSLKISYKLGIACSRNYWQTHVFK